MFLGRWRRPSLTCLCDTQANDDPKLENKKALMGVQSRFLKTWWWVSCNRVEIIQPQRSREVKSAAPLSSLLWKKNESRALSCDLLSVNNPRVLFTEPYEHEKLRSDSDSKKKNQVSRKCVKRKLATWIVQFTLYLQITQRVTYKCKVNQSRSHLQL